MLLSLAEYTRDMNPEEKATVADEVEGCVPVVLCMSCAQLIDTPESFLMCTIAYTPGLVIVGPARSFARQKFGRVCKIRTMN